MMSTMSAPHSRTTLAALRHRLPDRRPTTASRRAFPSRADRSSPSCRWLPNLQRVRRDELRDGQVPSRTACKARASSGWSRPTSARGSSGGQISIGPIFRGRCSWRTYYTTSAETGPATRIHGANAEALTTTAGEPERVGPEGQQGERPGDRAHQVTRPNPGVRPALALAAAGLRIGLRTGIMIDRKQRSGNKRRRDSRHACAHRNDALNAHDDGEQIVDGQALRTGCRFNRWKAAAAAKRTANPSRAADGATAGARVS